MDTPVATRSKLVVVNSTPDRPFIVENQLRLTTTTLQREKRRGRIVTDNICSVCYIDIDLIPPIEFRQLHDLG
eukprot:5422000-Ditylum_brightwellii.AAC.1